MHSFKNFACRTRLDKKKFCYPFRIYETGWRKEAKMKDLSGRQQL